MKIVFEKPPVYDRIVKAIGEPPAGALFTYGDTIYVPSGRTPPADLIAHEEQHMRQQGDNPELWWQQYLKDTSFRLAQETMAYVRQFEFLAAKRGTQKRRVMNDLASALSSPMYGSIVSWTEAWKAIAEEAA